MKNKNIIKKPYTTIIHFTSFNLIYYLLKFQYLLFPFHPCSNFLFVKCTHKFSRLTMSRESATKWVIKGNSSRNYAKWKLICNFKVNCLFLCLINNFSKDTWFFLTFFVHEQPFAVKDVQKKNWDFSQVNGSSADLNKMPHVATVNNFIDVSYRQKIIIV